jgi:hypothetical protein
VITVTGKAIGVDPTQRSSGPGPSALTTPTTENGEAVPSAVPSAVSERAATEAIGR